MSIASRISALELRSKGEQMLTIRISGGLPPGSEPITALAGCHRWKQDPGESEKAFADRVIKLANAVNEKTLVIGSLPND